MKTSRPPLIVAIVLLVLPVLYVASYLALVVPEGIASQNDSRSIGHYSLSYLPI